MPVIGWAFSNDIHHPARRAGAIARRRRAANDFDSFNLFRRYPVGIAAGITLAAPAIAYGVTRGHRNAINEDQGIFRPHTANIDLAVITAGTRRAVAGEVHPWHFANNIGEVVDRRVLFNIFAGNN